MAKQVPAEEKTAKPRRVNRAAAANRVVAAMTGKTTLTELADAADAFFVESGGRTNVRASAWYVRRSLETAEAFGVVRLTRPTDVMVERVKVR